MRVLFGTVSATRNSLRQRSFRKEELPPFNGKRAWRRPRTIVGMINAERFMSL